ncbi:unnamed protein product [Rotaria sordida]|uniref:Kinesin light chain n=1 Tax=Rotaria sordida TaxID=392033 RepID=A0A818K3G9_9BILA|nr:unnamed protein product [Rotaria sordida]CAF0731319.1 unnamed protein product [Rotaria sordida]CAF0735557.1 unnamed protein product [Rotaria sordida]CAF0795371.1 unnamed protein product [Rotaria sordida]CAF3483028.1 unnamed protein product [Rotaria sordida]
MSTTCINSDLTHSTRLVLSDLESLRHEHNLLLSSTIDDDNKCQRLHQSLESIDLGIDEAFVMLQLDNHLENLDSEIHKLMLQVQRLTQENSWLRDELSLTEKHLQTSTHIRQDYERDINLLNESLISSQSISDNINLTNSIDINTDIPIETKEQIQINSNTNLETNKNHSEIPPRFRTLHNLVIQYAQAGRYEVAVPLCRQALEDLEKTHGHTHPDVATMLNILALVYRDQNKFKEALQLLTEALTIREKTLGNEHPAVAATLNNLAVLYGKKNRYKEAEPLCKRALEIREKYFGMNHPDVGKQLNNLALLCLNQGKYDKVEEYYKRAIEIYTKNYGKNDSNVSKTKNNLASAYLREGKYKLAVQLYEEILSESQLISNEQCQSLNSNRDTTIIMTTLKNLGALCRRLNFYEQADLFELCATKSLQNQSDVINRALDILKQIQLNDDINHETIRRSQVPITQEYGKLRRSGSFQKLRQSIRRGSEKLVQKLRGTPSNLPSFNSMQFQQQDSTIKRASSMSVLNNVSPSYPLQQQQTNRTLRNIYSIDHQQQNKQQFIPPSRGRLTSAENIH